jgi:hypothetical protein
MSVSLLERICEILYTCRNAYTCGNSLQNQPSVHGLAAVSRQLPLMVSMQAACCMDSAYACAPGAEVLCRRSYIKASHTQLQIAHNAQQPMNVFCCYAAVCKPCTHCYIGNRTSKSGLGNVTSQGAYRAACIVRIAAKLCCECVIVQGQAVELDL